jgi:hypothetical protein
MQAHHAVALEVERVEADVDVPVGGKGTSLNVGAL